MSEYDAGKAVLGRSAIRRRILALVMDAPERRLHLRAIARAVGTSAGTAARELARLEDAGLLERAREGNQVYFRGRPDHLETPLGPPATRRPPDPNGLAVLGTMAVGLRAIYGDRLLGVYLYGSRARGDNRPDSDVDVLIVLDRIDNYWTDLWRSSELASEVSLDAGLLVSRVLASETDWMRASKPFLAAARREALRA